MKFRVPAIAITAALVAAPDLAGAQSKKNESPVAASRFGISVDGVQKPKVKGLKSQSGKKAGGGSGTSINPWLESAQAGQMGGKSAEALKSPGGKKGAGSGVKSYNLQQAWPKK
jgi:hypothetical protein